MNFKIDLLVLIMVTFQITSVFASESEYVEKGRFGLMSSITDDGVQFGPIYESDFLEAIAAIDSSTSKPTDGVSPKFGDTGIKLRLGLRNNIGSFNYISYGIAAYKPFGGTTSDGSSTNGTYKVGPYVGLQRHFSGTNLMLNIYIQPFHYEHDVQAITTNTWHIFQGGGFGVAYLFN